jgi:hypothetical protein
VRSWWCTVKDIFRFFNCQNDCCSLVEASFGDLQSQVRGCAGREETGDPPHPEEVAHRSLRASVLRVPALPTVDAAANAATRVRRQPQRAPRRLIKQNQRWRPDLKSTRHTHDRHADADFQRSDGPLQTAAAS